ncbi:MAG: ASCH domain-containing protein [Verrucomicrobia bacterium]|nr:ASCH domain-containing protein [Verrucomicrobiota bacterium]
MRIFRLRAPYFSMVQSGRKTVEGRLNKPDLHNLKVGERIRFQRENEVKHFVDVRVISLRQYPTFREMLKREGLNRCLPDVKTVEEGVQIYHSFPSYRENEMLYGALAIGIHPIKLGEKA